MLCFFVNIFVEIIYYYFVEFFYILELVVICSVDRVNGPAEDPYVILVN